MRNFHVIESNFLPNRQRSASIDGGSAIPTSGRCRAMVTVHRDTNRRRNGEEDSRPGPKHSTNAAIGQCHSLVNCPIRHSQLRHPTIRGALRFFLSCFYRLHFIISEFSIKIFKFNIFFTRVMYRQLVWVVCVL